MFQFLCLYVRICATCFSLFDNSFSHRLLIQVKNNQVILNYKFKNLDKILVLSFLILQRSIKNLLIFHFDEAFRFVRVGRIQMLGESAVFPNPSIPWKISLLRISYHMRNPPSGLRWICLCVCITLLEEITEKFYRVF